MKITLNKVCKSNFYPQFQKNQAKKNTKKSTVIYSGGTLLVSGIGVGIYIVTKKSKYISQLAKSLSKELGKEIKSSDLKCVLDAKELGKEVSKLSEANFVASAENIKQGIFCADLHSHTNFSDGKISIKDLLNQAAEYGNRLNKINGKKFLFSISDHDGIEGVKEALKLIAKEPQKYKNIKFVPACELSFLIKCEEGSAKFEQTHNPVETSELLIYGINPFSKTSEDFFKNTYKKRENAIVNAIEIANKEFSNCNFSVKEFEKFFLLKQGNKYCMMNQHWGLYNYFNLKYQISKQAAKSSKNKEELFDEIMNQMQEKKLNKNTYELKKIINDFTEDKDAENRIMEFCKTNICPTFKDNQIISNSEKSFEDIVEYANKENATLAFAHPIYTMQNFKNENIISGMKNFIDKSNEKIKYAEKYHQAYTFDNQEVINHYNKYLDSLEIKPIGGRDNHKEVFI